MARFVRRYRSFKKITNTDLDRLANLALENLHSLFNRKPKSRLYARRLMLLCLCQGAAQHYVFGDRGINDFDIWAFFWPHPKYCFPYRRHGRADFGLSRFGHKPQDKARFTGRRIDVMGRSISVLNGEKPIAAVRRYLSGAPRGSSPWYLAQRSGRCCLAEVQPWQDYLAWHGEEHLEV